MTRKYTKERLALLVPTSVSFADLMRQLGLTKWSGGIQNLLADRVKEYGLSTAHFTGQATNCGSMHRGGPDKKHFSEILVKRHTREQVARLRRALLESGRAHACEVCGQGPKWKGKVLCLQMDHKNGDRTDNRPKNLRFICPNCHSQTENFSGKTRSSGGMQTHRPQKPAP